jgi:hypothetical protein
MPDALRVQKTINYHGPKVARFMYQRALLTKMATRLETHVDEVVQMRNKFNSDFHRRKTS